MIQTFLSLLVSPFKTPGKSLMITIATSLITSVVTAGGMYVYGLIKTSTLERDLSQTQLAVAYKQIELAEATTAQRSCEEAIRRMTEAQHKKKVAIKEYEKNIHTGEKDAIHNVDDFIDFANRMQ